MSGRRQSPVSPRPSVAGARSHAFLRPWMLTSVLMLTAMPVVAQPCEPGETLAFQCDVRSGKRVTVCSSAKAASYRFGRPGAAPELVLRTPLAQLDYATSGGSSMDTTDVVFRNGSTGYRIEYTRTFERFAGGGSISHDGGEAATLIVLRADRPVAHLECKATSVQENFQSIPREPCRHSCSAGQ